MSVSSKNPKCSGCNKFLCKLHGQKKSKTEEEATIVLLTSKDDC